MPESNHEQWVCPEPKQHPLYKQFRKSLVRIKFHKIRRAMIVDIWYKHGGAMHQLIEYAHRHESDDFIDSTKIAHKVAMWNALERYSRRVNKKGRASA